MSWLKENIAPVLAILVVIFGFAYLYGETAYNLKQGAAIVALVAAVISFYFGSSSGSARKTELITPPSPSANLKGDDTHG